MGNTLCNEVKTATQEVDSILEITITNPTYPPIPSLQQQSVFDGREMNKSSIISSMKLKINKNRIITISIMNGEKIEKISIPFEKLKMKCSEYQKQEPKLNIYCVELGLYEGTIKEGQIIEYAIATVDQDNSRTTSLIAFVGRYKENKKQKGLHLFVKENLTFIFQGVFQEKERRGMKVVFGQNRYEKYWGKFNQEFQIIQEGKSLVYAQSQISGKPGLYYYFDGEYDNGSKEGKGILKIREEDDKLYCPRKHLNEKILTTQKLKQVKQLLQKEDCDYGQLSGSLNELIDALAGHAPKVPQIMEANDCQLIIEGTWKKDLIQGLTQQRWPLKNYRFYGVYKNNQRNGYGEEFDYDKKIGKGFYKKGVMEKDRDNEYMLLGFKLVNEQWRRNNQ